MGTRRACRAKFLLGVICLTAATVTLGQESYIDRLKCEGELDGRTLAADELTSILITHVEWLESNPDNNRVNKKSSMCGVILHQADLTDAELTEADLRETELSQADLNGARLARTTFEPATLPDPGGFLRVRGLSEIRFSGQVNPAVELRDYFRESGFRSQEKAVTAALTKHKLNAAPLRERLFQGYIAGGRITDYGANPWGALGWLSVLVFLFLWPYLLALQAQQQINGIWLIRSDDRVVRGQSEADQELVPYRGLMRSIPCALYFSVLSAFHFGWRELNLGNWIVRLQFREYTLRPTGWVRAVSGLQSLSSLYLVALFLISYFGDPFA